MRWILCLIINNQPLLIQNLIRISVFIPQRNVSKVAKVSVQKRNTTGGFELKPAPQVSRNLG
jgi:hypothetical protein